MVPRLQTLMMSAAHICDIRVKVCGFRDALSDGDRWWIESPFTTAVGQLSADAQTLTPAGGRDGYRSLLDGLWRVANLPSTAAHEPLRGDAWRDRRHAIRLVLAMTDGETRVTLADGTAAGRTHEDVWQTCVDQRINLLMICAETENHARLACGDNFEVEWLDSKPSATEQLHRLLEHFDVAHFLAGHLGRIALHRSELPADVIL